MSQPIGKSPYKRYSKRPVQYSEAYQRWRRAAILGNDGESRRLAWEHTEKWLGEFIRLEIANGNRPDPKEAAA
jgi:hypothetical protein